MIHYAREVECKDLRDFFYKWFIVIRPVVQLTEKETCTLANLAYERYKLSETINDDAILDSVVLNKETCRRVAQDSNITREQLWVYMSAYKKNGIIKNGRFDLSLLPPLKPKTKDFNMAYLFKINELR